MKNKQKRTRETPIKIKKHGLYFVSNKDLNIRHPNGSYIDGGHIVIVTNLDKKGKTAKVKTITSVSHCDRANNRLIYDRKTLNQAMDNKALIVSRKDLNSKNLSAIIHDKKKVKLSALKTNYSSMRFPKRYASLIDRK